MFDLSAELQGYCRCAEVTVWVESCVDNYCGLSLAEQLDSEVANRDKPQHVRLSFGCSSECFVQILGHSVPTVKLAM